MPEVIIKYFFIMISSLYVFLKLLHLKLRFRVFLLYLFFAVLITLLIYILPVFYISLNSILIFVYLVVFTVKMVKVSSNLSMTTSVISIAISYGTFLISATLVSLIKQSTTLLLDRNYFSNLILVITTGLVQLLLVTVPFKAKRLKNGMPFLLERGSNDVGVFISISLLLSASFFNANNKGELIYILPIFFILITGFIVLFWWRNSIAKKYLEKVKAQEIQVLNDTIDVKDCEVSLLKQQNEELSKIIHKDNKLIPALEYAVRQYLLMAESETDNAARLAKGMALLSQIEGAYRERAGIIASYESGSKSLPKTGVPSVDSLLTYMFQKSREQQIDFNVTVSGSVKYLIENIAAEQDINTLLADLIENAIIAIKKSAPKNILVHIGIIENCYSISIFDNGLPFTPETINDIGLTRTTTHAGEGGSGIGLLTTFEILKKYQASFEIEDIEGNVLYTKKVTVCFDTLSQFRIQSAQLNNYELISAREDIVFVREIGA